MKPTILYIGDFSQFYATENYISYGLERLGYQVLRAPEATIKNAKVVLGAALKYNVEFVLFSKGHFAGSEEAIKLLREHGIVTVGWLFDLFFDVPLFFGRRQLTNNAFRADITCMTDGGHQDKWKEFNVNHKLLRQGIHEPDAFFGTTDEKIPPILFFGTYSYQERMDLIDKLRAEYGDDFRHYGRGGNVREIRGPALNNIISGAKIVVGDSMPADYYWSNRIYEMLGRGAFLLHPYVKGLETEFEDGVHYVSYKYGNFYDLKEKLTYYLNHPEEREKIKKAGHELVKTKYTYQKRCEKLIEYVNEYKRKNK